MEGTKCDKFTQCNFSSVPRNIKCDVTTQCTQINRATSVQYDYKCNDSVEDSFPLCGSSQRGAAAPIESITLPTDELSDLNPGEILLSMLPPLQNTVDANALISLSQQSLYVGESQDGTGSTSICECCHRTFDSSELTSVVSYKPVSSSPMSNVIGNDNDVLNKSGTDVIGNGNYKTLSKDSKNISSDETVLKMTYSGETSENRATKVSTPELTESSFRKIDTFSKEQCADDVQSERNGCNQFNENITNEKKSKNAHETSLKKKGNKDGAGVSNATQVSTVESSMFFNSLACERDSSPEDLCEELCRELSKAEPNCSKYMKKVSCIQKYKSVSGSIDGEQQKFSKSSSKTPPRKLSKRRYESKHRKGNLVSIHSDSSGDDSQPESRKSFEYLKRRNIPFRKVISRHTKSQNSSGSDSPLKKRYESKSRNVNLERRCASNSEDNMSLEGRKYDKRSKTHEIKKVNWERSMSESSSDDDYTDEGKKSTKLAKRAKSTLQAKERGKATSALSNTTQELIAEKYLYFNSLACERASSPEELCEETCIELAKAVPNSFKLMEKMLNVDTRYVGSKKRSSNILREKQKFSQSPSKITSRKLSESRSNPVQCVTLSDSDCEEPVLPKEQISARGKRKPSLSKKGNRSGRMSENSSDSDCIKSRRKGKIGNKTINLASSREPKERRNELTRKRMSSSSRHKALVSYSDSSSENETLKSLQSHDQYRKSLRRYQQIKKR